MRTRLPKVLVVAEDGGDDLHPQRLHGFIIDGELPPAPENASTK